VHLHLHYLDELRRVYFMRVSVPSREMAISLGPQGTLVTGMKTEPAIVKLTSETCIVNLRLLCLDKMRHICFYARLLSLN
jgi:hypothetical protein